MEERKEKLIGEIKKNQYDYLRFFLVEYMGKEYLDIRVFFRNGKGHFIPTDNGISLGEKRLELAIELMSEAKKLMMDKQVKAEDEITSLTKVCVEE